VFLNKVLKKLLQVSGYLVQYEVYGDSFLTFSFVTPLSSERAYKSLYINFSYFRDITNPVTVLSSHCSWPQPRIYFKASIFIYSIYTSLPIHTDFPWGLSYSTSWNEKCFYLITRSVLMINPLRSKQDATSQKTMLITPITSFRKQLISAVGKWISTGLLLSSLFLLTYCNLVFTRVAVVLTLVQAWQ
jgi:hypothetical protein